MDVTQTPANSVKGKDSNQTAGRKRKGKNTFNMAYGEPANNITEDGTDAPTPSTSPKRSLQDPFLLNLATRASDRRKLIKKVITDINNSSDQDSNSVEPANPDIHSSSDQRSSSIEPANPLPRAVDRLSNPKCHYNLPFPFVFAVVPSRFKAIGAWWPYMGRTKFKELLEALKEVRKSSVRNVLWLYGTQGYGKSHLLAALVCYLAAQDERVVYIPDCRTWIKDPVGCIRAAMLFAWADDVTAQEDIMTLDTMRKVETFFSRQEDVIVVSDQLNGFEESDGPNELYNRLQCFTLNHTAVFSSSANYREYLIRSKKQTSDYLLSVYGGLDRVSHRKIMSQ
jgi:hypothetical protein